MLYRVSFLGAQEPSKKKGLLVKARGFRECTNPESHTEASFSGDAVKWEHAMGEELKSLQKNKTWDDCWEENSSEQMGVPTEGGSRWQQALESTARAQRVPTKERC